MSATSSSLSDLLKSKGKVEDISSAALDIVKQHDNPLNVDDLIYREVLWASSIMCLNSYNRTPFCALCWRFELSHKISKQACNVTIAKSHVVPNCLLKHMGSYFLKDGQLVTTEKVKYYMCCASDSNGDFTRLASCEGITGASEAVLENFITEHKINKDQALSLTYSKWLFIAVAAICWRAVVRFCDKVFSLGHEYLPSQQQTIKLEKSLRSYLYRMIKLAEKKKTDHSIADTITPTFKLLFSAYSTSSPGSSSFASDNLVDCFVSPISQTVGSPVISGLFLFHLQFTVCVDEKDILDQVLKEGASVLEHTIEDRPLNISQISDRKSYSLFDSMLSLHMSGIQNQALSIPQEHYKWIDPVTSSPTPPSHTSKSLQQGECISALPDTIRFKPSVNGLGSFEVTQKGYSMFYLVDREKLKIVHMKKSHQSAPSFWYVLTIDQDGGTLVTATEFRLDNKGSLIEDSVSPFKSRLMANQPDIELQVKNRAKEILQTFLQNSDFQTQVKNAMEHA